jgi:hypothetical protein
LDMITRAKSECKSVIVLPQEYEYIVN